MHPIALIGAVFVLFGLAVIMHWSHVVAPEMQNACASIGAQFNGNARNAHCVKPDGSVWQVPKQETR